jgi:hypothetical protein
MSRRKNWVAIFKNAASLSNFKDFVPNGSHPVKFLSLFPGNGV